MPRSNPAMGVPAATRDLEGAAERVLVDRARGGDAEAFRELVERHRDRVYGLALRMLRSPAEAEEVAQDAFVRAWRALPRFRGDAAFGTWLHAIVVRRSIDRATVLKNRRAREVRYEEAGDLPEPVAPDPGVEGGEMRRRLGRLLEQLSPVQRAAVALFYDEDRPVEEIARIMGMPESTVKTHLSRARAVLRRGWLGGDRS